MSINFNGRVVENKPKYINEQGGSKLTYNFVTDPRVKRGHNFGIIYVTSSNYDDNSSKNQKKKVQGLKQSKNLLKSKNYLGQSKDKEEMDKKRNDKEGECGICTTKVITTVRPTPITFEEMVQTDPLPPPPQPVLIWKQKEGKDVECQIEDGDLFDFDEEVKPLIHIIVSKTIEDARREVLEEEEIRHIMEQQEKYRKLNEYNNNRVRQIEEDEKNRFEEHKRKKELKNNRINLTKMFQKKLQSRMKAKQYISKLKLDCYNSLGQKKVFKNKEDNYYFTDLLPEMQSLVDEYTRNDYLIVNKMNDMFSKTKYNNDCKKHYEAVTKEKKRLANNERIRRINQELEEKRKREEKEIDELIKNKNLTIQEKITINLEKELNQLKLEQKNLLYSNEEMLKLDPNDKVVRESIEINIAIYNKNEKRIKEIEQKIIYLNINSEENNNDDHSNINSNWSSYWLFWNSFITKNRYY